MITVWVVMVLSAIGVSAAGFFGLFSARGQGQGENPALAQEIFSVDGQPVTLGQLNAQIDGVRQQFGSISEPAFDFQFMAAAVRSLIDQSVMANMAAARGVAVNDELVLSMASDQLDQSINQFRATSISSGDLKADATEAEFQKFFEEKQGMSTKAAKEKVLDELKAALADSTRRPGVVNQYAQQALERSFYGSTQVTEDEVKKSYESLSYLTIAFDKQEMGLVERKAEAEKALAEIKAGADFLAVQKKYQTTPNTEPVKYSRSVIDDDPTLKPLASLKVGEVSNVLVEFGSIPRVYKLTTMKSELPADFETNKSMYTETFRRQKGANELSKAVEAGRSAAKIVWKSPGYEAVYKVASATMDNKLSTDEVKKQLTDIARNTKVSADDPAGTMPAILARYMAMESLDFHLTEAERKELASLKAEIINDVLLSTESISLRLSLVDTYFELGDDQSAVAMLQTAAEMNTGFEPINQNYFDQINEKLNKLQADKKVEETKANEIRAILVKWSQDKAEADELQKQTQSELDKFNVPNPVDDAAKKAAEDALKEANKPKQGG